MATSAAANPSDHGLGFVTVGDPGNRAASLAEALSLYDTGFYDTGFAGDDTPGAVGYEYRIMRNDVAVDTWVEFLNAFRPHVGNDPLDLQEFQQFTVYGYDRSTDEFRGAALVKPGPWPQANVRRPAPPGTPYPPR